MWLTTLSVNCSCDATECDKVNLFPSLHAGRRALAPAPAAARTRAAAPSLARALAQTQRAQEVARARVVAPGRAPAIELTE